MVISPDCEADWHWSRAKSSDVQRLIASGLPKTPSGVLKLMLRAASGAPGESREKVVTMSGWPPTLVVEIVDSNESIDWVAKAEPAMTTAASADNATARPVAPNEPLIDLPCCPRSSATPV